MRQIAQIATMSDPFRALRRLAAAAGLLSCLAACSAADEAQHRATDSVDVARTTAERRDSVPDGTGATCRGVDLALSLVGADAGAGNRGVTYALTNVGPQPCTLVGHPGISLVDSAGRPLPGVRFDEIPAIGAEAGQPTAPVTLAPDGQATFTILFTGIAAGTLSCTDAAAVRVTPPGSDTELRIPAALHVCGDRVRVTPLVSAAGALVGSYRAEPGAAAGKDAGARLLTLSLGPGDSAVVEMRQAGARTTVRSRGSWTVRDSIVVVRLADVRPFSWIVGGGYLRPLAWDTAAYGRSGVAMVRVGDSR